MGASQSSSSTHNGTRTGGRPTTAEGIDLQDYYGLLELPDPAAETSTNDDVRKSYRRLALRYHPDKNPDNVEAANERFRLVQAAYEVLSDEQERAWYDSHREQILQGVMDDDAFDGEEEDAFDEETFQNFRTGKQRPPPAPTGSSLPGLSIRQLMRFLDVSLCMDVTPPSADEAGFFGTYRRIFERLADEEKGAAPYPGEHSSPYEDYPSFGYSHTPYLHKRSEEAGETVFQTQVRDFYAVWGAFSTRKGFSWRDGYRTNDAPDRRVKRAMEKENKRMRETSRREYNDTVRSLVNFVRKRDPRVKAHLAAQSSSSASSAEEMQRRREAAEREMRRQEELARTYKKQSWDAWEHGGAESDETDDDSQGSFGENVEGQGVASADEDDGDEQDGTDKVDDLTCYACDKTFQSVPAFANHERSNKHKKEVQKLRREMLKEDREMRKRMDSVVLDSDKEEDEGKESSKQVEEEEQEEAEEAEVDPTAGLSKKAKQRLKKRMKEQEKAASSTTGTAQASEDEQEKGESQQAPPEAEHSARFESNAPDDGAPSSTKQSGKGKREKKGGKGKERCNVCKTPFDSRSKLFNHIRETGHALAAAQPTTSNGKRR